MKRLLHLAIFAGLAPVVSGCGHLETHAVLLRAVEPGPSKSVELYLATQANPQRAYYEVALVQAIGYGSHANAEDVAAAMKDKADALGCDAVVKGYVDVGYTRAHAAGVCVRWLGPGPAAPTPILPPASTAIPPQPPPLMPRIEPLPSSSNLGR